MPAESIDWFINTTREQYKKAQADQRFPYIVALGRAVNALNFVRSLVTLRSNEDDSPAAKRDRMNSYLFGSAIMYEALGLVKKMNKTFANDPVFQNGLRLLLKDKSAQRIERDHLDPLRNQAVFHFDPERFDEAIQRHVNPENFCAGRGKKKGGIYFSYSDMLTVEILMGTYTPVETGLDDFTEVVKRTDALTAQFVGCAEDVIRQTLAELGFELNVVTTGTDFSPSPQI